MSRARAMGIVRTIAIDKTIVIAARAGVAAEVAVPEAQVDRVVPVAR